MFNDTIASVFQYIGGNSMKDVMISESVIYVGVDDKTIDLFESQYPVPNGVSYNLM